MANSPETTEKYTDQAAGVCHSLADGTGDDADQKSVGEAAGRAWSLPKQYAHA
jgi:hypothetical protein